VEADTRLQIACQRLLGELAYGLGLNGDLPLSDCPPDTHQIVQDAVMRMTGQCRIKDGQDTSNWPTIQRVLDKLTEEAMADEVPDAGWWATGISPWDDESTIVLSFGNEHLPELANWLDRFHDTMNRVSPHAIPIWKLRLDGYADREIADRLGLGPRLVRQVRLDVRQAQARKQQEE
jgi:hypothetical protein